MTPAPEPTTTALPDYAGKKVLRTSIAIRNAGDGLSEGMAIDPEVLEIGTRHYVVLEVTTTGHNHKPLKGGTPDYLELEQVLSAGTAVIVDEALVAEVLEKQRRKLALAKEAAQGIGHIGYDEDAEAALAAHKDGLHATGLVPGCPECERENDAAQAEHQAEQAAAADTSPVTPLAGRKRKGNTEK